MATALLDEDYPDLGYEADLCGNIEQALKALQGYGIMALELIQNADDAHATTLRINARDDALVVENNESFSRCSLMKKECDWATGDVLASSGRRSCNFHAITNMGGRSKLGSKDQIGRFGIGFVSVYQVTDTPIVRSVGVEYTLNPRDRRARRRKIDETSGTELVLPWAFANSPVREAIHQNVVPTDVADKVVDAVAAILPKSVLFLRHLQRIEVCREGRVKASVDIERTADGVDLRIGPSNTMQHWIVQSRDASGVVQDKRLYERFPGLRDLERSTTVSVAFPVDLEVDDGLLYAYLPTKKATGLPLHINADFFPHASRQEIVLGAESQDSFWNEAMLAAAAEIIGDRFELLKATLGHRRLWKLGEASRVLASKEPAFACFWKAFIAGAKACDSVWTLGGGWQHPAAVRSSPAVMSEAEQNSLASFGLSMLHPSLREHLNALSAAGVVMLKVTDVANALSLAGSETITSDNPNLSLLWSALNGMLEPSRGFPAAPTTSPAPLANVKFLLDWSGAPVSPNGAWRLPDNVPAELLMAVTPNPPLVHSDLLRHPNLLKQLKFFGLDEFARLLGQMIPDEEAAASMFGAGGGQLGKAYKLLTLLWQEQRPTEARAILLDVPFLRKADGRFATPARALLPGEFRDPTGWFDFVDVDPFPVGMHRFAEEVLGIGVMDFAEFVSEHLADTIERGVTLEQYRALMAEIADHRHQLEGVLDALSNVPFVRNRAGDFVLPRECYFWDAALETVLGSDRARWVDYSWLPPSPDRQKRLRDLLEAKLGMPSRVAAKHIVERIEQIAKEAAPGLAKKELTPIFRHLIEVWPRLDSDYRDQLAELRAVSFLPGQLDGSPDEEKLHRPDEVYRAGRAPGFSTQVPIVDLAPLRENRKIVNELLELIGVPEEPETSVIVDHLIACMNIDRDPHPLTYLILGERCEEGDGIEEIDRLQGLPCIYDPSLGYLKASRVFWSDPPIARYWHRAHTKMSERQTLFNRLGVSICPGPTHYSELALEVAAAPTSEYQLGTHERCMRFLAEALWNVSEGASEAVDALAGEESLLTISGTPIWPADALWMDSEQHLTPFGSDLDDIVVIPPSDCDIAALRKLYRRLRTPTLSDEVRLELAGDPGATMDQDATDILRERAALLLRLAPTRDSRTELRRLVDHVTVRLAPTLLTKAELVRNGITHGSDAVEADAFIDRAEPAIFLAGTRVKWALLARHLFDAIAPLCPTHDMRSLAGTAINVLQASSLEEANETMDELHYLEQVAEENLPSSEEDTLNADGWWSDGDHGEVEDGAGPIEPHGDVGGPGDGWHGGGGQPGSTTQQPQAAGETSGTHSPPGPSGAGAINDPEASYKSKTGTSDVGSPPSGIAGSPSSPEDATGPSNGGGGFGGGSGQTATGDKKSRAERTERRKRRQSRLLSYVASDDYESITDDDKDGDDEPDDRTDATGMAAAAAVMAYENYHGRVPEEMPHYNPGFDVSSTDKAGNRRLIEVKGIDGEWNQVGVKLSRRQFRFAQENPKEFWLYVVEHALDPQKRLVRPLWNPFARVDGFLFDHEWRKASEGASTSKEMLVQVGANVEDWRWGRGIVTELMGRGLAQQAKVRFPIFGLKAIPVSKLNIVD